MKLADALVEGLIALDVRYVFGVSGANIEHFHDAIHRRRGPLTAVLARTESGAAFMADARARVHRVLGACCSTSGGGMMNLAVGIAESFAESTPVLAIVGQPPTSLEGRGAFQDSSGIGRSVDALGLFRAISKCALKITHPDQFWPFFMKAVITALSGRQGPAVLLVPSDLWSMEVQPVAPADLLREIEASTRPLPVGQEAAQWILDEIRGAHRPVMLIGHGVRRSSDPVAVVELARAIGIPVVTTMSARAEFDNNDPLYLGVLGVAGHPSAHDWVRDKADLIVVVGAGLNKMTRASITQDPVDLPSKRMVVINVDASEIRRVIAPDLRAPSSSRHALWPDATSPLAYVLEADAGTACREMLALWRERPFRVAPPGDYVRSYFQPRLAPPLDRAAPPPEGEPNLRQSDAIAILQSYLPRAGNVLFDAGNCAASALHFLDIEPGVSATIALGMAGMGYAIAGAVGAQLGAPPGTRTVVVTGDGSFLMTGLEIHTAVDLRLPILYVVFNNNMHGMCATRQQLFFESRIECSRYAPVDVAQVVRGLAGPDALWVGAARNPDELYERADDYLGVASDRPGVLELCLDREELPAFLPFLPPDAARTSALVPSPGRPPSSRVVAATSRHVRHEPVIHWQAVESREGDVR